MNLVKRLAKLESRLKRLEEENLRLKAENRRLREENRQLRLQLYGIKPRKRSTGSKRGKSSSVGKKRGPPEGHEGRSRSRPERADVSVALTLANCPHCGTTLDRPCGEHSRFIEDVVLLPLYVTEYRVKHYYCTACRRVVYASLPYPANLRFGLSFLLLVTYLRFGLNLPYGKIALLLNRLFNANVSEGSVVAYVKRMAQLLGSEYEGIKRAVREQNLCVDETGKRIAGENFWLWVFAGSGAVLYHTAESRGSRVAIEVLGEDYEHTTVSDFYSAYNLTPGRKQRCWAHLLREAEAVARRSTAKEAKLLLQQLRDVYAELKSAAKLEEQERLEARRRLLRRLRRIATGKSRDCEVRRLRRRIEKHAEEMLTCLLTEVEPTNNFAERMLRQCVVQRKIWGSFRSEWGAKAQDVVMSVMQTWNLQGKDFFEAGAKAVANAVA